MRTKRIIPCLDIKDGSTVKGINFENLQKVGDPVTLAKEYCKQMADELVFLDITATVEVRETFHISKVGTVAGGMVKEGKIKRGNKVRLIRDGIVIYTGDLASLKRMKDDVKEVATGYECGLSIQNYNDVKVGDIIESFEEIEVKQTL